MLKLSKKHIFLYRIHCELEERVQKGEEIPFNFECSSRFLDQLKCPQENGTAESFTSISCVTRRENSIQQTTITSTHLSLIADKKKPFVLIEREQTVVEQDADSDYVEDDEDEEEPLDDEENLEYDSEDALLNKKAPRRSTRSNRPGSSTTPKTPPSPLVEKKKNYSRKVVDTNPSHGEQNECCLIGCTNSVTNRLRFSLRCHKSEDFKPSFLSAGWNKVCHYHYFSDLYKYKKNNGSSSRSKNNKKSASTKKTSGSKRKRVEDDIVPDDENMDPQIQLDDEEPVQKKSKTSSQDGMSLLHELSA